MSLTKEWASPEDFATLFQYCWYRDFPIDQKATGAGRVDWTIHIGLVVRNVADLMGFVTRFERGSRKDAILRDVAGDEVAVEWEWNGVFGNSNELEKLRDHRVRPEGKERLKYSVLVTYADTAEIEEVYGQVTAKWDERARWPLLLILIDVANVAKSKYSTGREFSNIQMSVFDNGKREDLRLAPALPWKVSGTRWSIEHVGQWK